MLFTNTVERKTYELLKNISSEEVFTHFYLGGGTALALQIGHRISIDLDFFTSEEFDAEQIIDYLKPFGKIEVTNTAQNTVQCYLNDIKVDFLRHNYPIVKTKFTEEGITFAILEDIAAMKLYAIHNRGARKDFYDLYFLLEIYSLEQLLGFYHSKYERNILQLLKSLSYFEDAEHQPEVILLKQAEWIQVKNFITYKIGQFLE